MSKELVWLDNDTGEIESFIGEYRTQDQLEAQMKYCKNKELQAFNLDFTWIIFEYGQQLFPNIGEKNLTRLIYLSTFCNYDGSLPPKKFIKEKLKLSNKYWSQFLNEMKDNKIIIEEGGNLYLNKNFFTKGSIQTGSNYTRLFCKFIRDIYDTCDNVKSIAQISYLYRLIPFVNRRTNMVCKNPDEQDPNKVCPITLGEFCDMVGYNKKNAKRLASDLLELKCNGQNLIGFFVTNMNQTTWKIVVNPRIYYGGKNDNIYKAQLALLSDYNPQDELRFNNTKLLEGEVI